MFMTPVGEQQTGREQKAYSQTDRNTGRPPLVAMAHNYDVGTQAWQPDPTEGWVASEVEQKVVDGNKVKLVFQLVNGEVGRQSRSSKLLQHADSPKVQNDRDDTGRVSG